MNSSIFNNRDSQQMSYVILELLHLTKGMEFAVLSSQKTAESQGPSGILQHSSSNKESKVVHKHARLQSYSEQQFLTDETVKNIIFHAFFSGHLGIKDHHKRYAFNKDRSNELKEAGIKTVIVTNIAQEEQVEQDISLDIISDEVFQKLIEMLNKKNKDDHRIEKKIEISDFKYQTSPNQTKRRASPKYSNTLKTSKLVGDKKAKEEEITESTRSENRKRKKDAEEKDELAFKKRKIHIDSERLKDDIKKSSS
ncbi:MAG: hypothetical protein H0X29_09395 [Parachlamydiaceae bacterium]|nr:hypothetical protein [Parachlamydiaceae bacterium]